MATTLGREEAKLNARHRKIYKKHFKGRTFDQEVKEYGTRVADYNAGWLEGWADGEKNGRREAKAELRAKKKRK